MQEKTEDGRTTVMHYNSANEITSVECDGQTIKFTYDNAGRLISQQSTLSNQLSQKTYGYLDKVITVSKPDGSRSTFEYWPDGQLAAGYELAASDNQSSTFKNQKLEDDYLWDGLATIYHNGETYVVEPHANGGSRIARFKDGQISYDINDLLGTTLAVVSDTHLHLSSLTAFGKPKTVAPNPGTPAPLDAPVAPPQTPNLQQQQIRIK